MAIDTRDKRACVIGVGSPYRVVLPNPDAAAENQGDRQQVGDSYRGILAGAPVAVVVAAVTAIMTRAWGRGRVS